jgi:hypothetical protein
VADKVLLISGTGPVDLKYLAQFRERLRGDPALEVEEIDNASVAELIAIVSHLPRETIVLPIQYVRDPAGNSYLSRDVFSQIAAASTALSMRFQTLIWERARLVNTLSTWRRPGKSRQMQPHRSFAEKSRQMSPWSRPECSEPCGTELPASRQSGRRWQTLSVWHATHLCHRAT